MGVFCSSAIGITSVVCQIHRRNNPVEGDFHNYIYKNVLGRRLQPRGRGQDQGPAEFKIHEAEADAKAKAHIVSWPRPRSDVCKSEAHDKADAIFSCQEVRPRELISLITITGCSVIIIMFLMFCLFRSAW